MQARISSVRPSRALVAKTGSAIWPRTTPIMSAGPSARIRSASAGSLIRPVANTGSETTSLTPAASGSV